MGSTKMQIHLLTQLSDSDCWSVLSELAFHGKEKWDREILKETGLEIMKKCKGLPLAAKAIGSLLRFKHSLEEWRNVLKSEIWELEKAKTDIFPFLVVAKRCFSYCAIFPKDMNIKVDKLVRMWWAQGFLSSIDGGGSDDVELKGREIFDDLVMRSFFQDFEMDALGDNVVSCKMHDIVHDFAQFLTKNECLIVEKVDAVKKPACVESARHLNLMLDKASHWNLMLDKAEADKKLIPISIFHEKCRSFLLTGKCVIPANSLGHLKGARVLVLYNYGLEEIPSEIGSLIHLRYLDLSGNMIKELPETICDLYNLQTLVIERCHNLSQLPKGIHKLRNLRHLLNYDTKLESLQGLEELPNLETISFIVASKENLMLLGHLNQLRGSLCLYFLSLEEADAIKKADLKSKNFIRKLEVRCAGLDIRYYLFEAIEPHPNLQILYLEYILFVPQWTTTLANLRKLTILGHILFPEVINVSLTPALGSMPMLEDLTLGQFQGIERLGHEFLGLDSAVQPTHALFPRLRKLKFSAWRKWSEWEDISEEVENNISIFPHLELLEIYSCAALTMLPSRLLHKASSLKRVKIKYCPHLSGLYKKLQEPSEPLGFINIPGSYFR